MHLRLVALVVLAACGAAPSDKSKVPTTDVNVSSIITDVPVPRKSPTVASAKPAAVARTSVVVTQIAAHGDTTCARLADATVRCWGENEFNVVSPVRVGMMEDHVFSGPVAIVDLPRAAQVVVGEAHACARLEDGTVSCWGTDDGTLGLGSALPPGPPPSTDKPMPVLKLHGVTDLSSNGHLCALLSDASVTCWHDYDSGTGDPRDKGSRAPVVVPGFADAVQIADGGNISCALLANGKVRCWRDVSPGLIPRGKVRVDPVDVTGLGKDVVSIFAGASGGCAITETHEIRCFGEVPFEHPQTQNRLASYSVSLPKDVSSMALGGDLACSIVSSGDVLCDTVDYSNHHTPKKIDGITNAVEIVVGSDHACARTTAGVSCWGRNDKGQLGDGTKDARTNAAPVQF